MISVTNHEVRPCCQWPGCVPGHGPSFLTRRPGWSGWSPEGWPLQSASLYPKTGSLVAPPTPRRHCTLSTHTHIIRHNTDMAWNTQIVMVHRKTFFFIICASVLSVHTQDVHSLLHNLLPGIQNGLVVGHIHLEDVQCVPVHRGIIIALCLLLGPHKIAL